MPLTAIEIAMRRMKQNEKKSSVKKQSKKVPVVKKIVSPKKVHIDKKKTTPKKVVSPEKLDFNGKIITIDIKRPISTKIRAKLVSTADDGNCFFDSLSKGLTQFGIHKSISELRNEIADYIGNNEELYSIYFEGMSENPEYYMRDQKGNIIYRIDKHVNEKTGKVNKFKVPEKISFSEFVNKIRTTKMFADQIELSIVCHIYKINLVVVDVGAQQPTLTNFECPNTDRNIYLYHTSNHYQLLVDIQKSN